MLQACYILMRNTQSPGTGVLARLLTGSARMERILRWLKTIPIIQHPNVYTLYRIIQARRQADALKTSHLNRHAGLHVH